MSYFVILSEAKNLSLFLFLYLNRREILRFAQNDSALSFSQPVEPAPQKGVAKCGSAVTANGEFALASHQGFAALVVIGKKRRALLQLATGGTVVQNPPTLVAPDWNPLLYE